MIKNKLSMTRYHHGLLLGCVAISFPLYAAQQLPKDDQMTQVSQTEEHDLRPQKNQPLLRTSSEDHAKIVKKKFESLANLGDLNGLKELWEKEGGHRLDFKDMYQALYFLVCDSEHGSSSFFDCERCEKFLNILLWAKEQGFDFNQKKEASDFSLLHKASIHGGLPVVKFLVENGADVNSYIYDRDDTGWETAFTCAVSAKNLATVKFLFESGATFKRRKRSILSYLMIERCGLICASLEDMAPYCSHDSDSDALEVAKYLVEVCGADPGRPCPHGNKISGCSTNPCSARHYPQTSAYLRAKEEEWCTIV